MPEEKLDDIGVVIYSIKSGDCIEAVWYSNTLDNNETGTGVAYGNTENGFSGSYQITYYHGGNNLGTFDLLIEQKGQVYELKWLKDGALMYFGVGLESDQKLSVGWRRSS